MAETDDARRQRYERVAQSCQECRAYRPRTSKQCRIYRLLLHNMRPDMVANEALFLSEGITCKGFEARR